MAVYGFDENKDKAKVLPFANVSVAEKNMTKTVDLQTSVTWGVEFTYPEGFTINNCFVIAYYSYTYNNETVMQVFGTSDDANVKERLTIEDNKVWGVLDITNPVSGRTYKAKCVFIKYV